MTKHTEGTHTKAPIFTVPFCIVDMNVSGPRIAEILMESFNDAGIIDATYSSVTPKIVTLHFANGEDALAWKLKD